MSFNALIMGHLVRSFRMGA